LAVVSDEHFAYDKHRRQSRSDRSYYQYCNNSAQHSRILTSKSFAGKRIAGKTVIFLNG
jgi:hypothetical protein